MEQITLSHISGFFVGHAENRAAGTGCNVILTPNGAVASAYNPGFAPGSRETDLLKPENTVDRIHGLLLAGGSAFGLAAAEGVMRFLREKKLGFDTGFIKVPLVAAAVIYDYPGNNSRGSLPDASLGYMAAFNAGKSPVKSGFYGAGISATCGKAAGPALASPSGLGSFGYKDGELMVAALSVVNPFGSIVDPDSGRIIAGMKLPNGALADKHDNLKAIKEKAYRLGESYPGNTVLAAVGTNARLDKLGAYRLARMASAGLSRVIYPASLLFDGDTIFALSSNDGPEVDEGWLGSLAAEVVARSIVESARCFEKKNV